MDWSNRAIDVIAGSAGAASPAVTADGQWRSPAAEHSSKLPGPAVPGPFPNRKRIADFTNIWTFEGWLYVSTVIDLFSRRVVDADALLMAVWRRGRPKQLLHHSDRATSTAASSSSH